MGKALGILIWLIAIAVVLLFVGQSVLFGTVLWWFPDNVAAHGKAIDAQFSTTMVVVGIGFLGAQLLLGYAVFRYGRKGSSWATYSVGNNRLELIWTAVTAVVFISLGILGQRVWAQLRLNEAPAEAIRIEVVAQQFQFNVHYPGPDGQMGRTDLRYVNDSALNFVGVDPTDPAGKDDIQVTTLAVPLNRPVELTLKSKDVIHNFFVPAMRFKQDMVPGMSIRVSFTPTKAGRYEVPCAELCGQLHYNMKTFLVVVPEDEYDALIALADEQFKERLGGLLRQFN